MGPVTVIIPVKDEEVGLQYLFGSYQKSNLRAKSRNLEFIIVIDGRTSDNSRAIAEKFSNRIIDQKETHGKGAAIKQALEEWKNNRSRLVIFLDADGSYSFDSVGLVIDELESGTDVVSGSRFLNPKNRPEGMSRLHNFGNRTLSIISSFRNRRKISDLCTGLWGFQSHSIEAMEIKSNGFDLEAEIAGKIRRAGLTHREIPVAWSQRRGGTSKLRSLTDGFIIFLRILIT
jgi:dolichol-phosphate mannosyltransferase